MAGVKGKGRAKGAKGKVELRQRVPLGRQRRSYMSSPSGDTDVLRRYNIPDSDVVVTEKARIGTKIKGKAGRPKRSGNVSTPSKNEDYGHVQGDTTKELPKITTFLKGHPGGPGRPEGSRNKVSIVLEQIGEENAHLIYQKMLELALKGDFNACKFILDKVMPPLKKGRRLEVALESPIRTIDDLSKFSNQIINMVANGDLSAEEAMDYGKICEQELKMMTDTGIVKKIESTCQLVDIIKNGK